MVTESQVNEFIRTWAPVFGPNMQGGFRAFMLRYHPDRAPPQQRNDANRISQIINAVYLLLQKISTRRILTGSDFREMSQLITQKREFDELKAKLDAYIITPERDMREEVMRRDAEEARRRDAEEARRRAELERIRREVQQARERARVVEERLRREAEERRQEEARREAEEVTRRWREEPEFQDRKPPTERREEEPAEEPFTVPKEQMSFEDYERELARQEAERRKKIEKEEEASKRARERYGFILRIESYPSGAEFELRDNTRVIAQNKTPFEINLPRGTYIVEVLNYTYVGRKSYFFTRWENDDTQKKRVIQLNSNITIKADYEIPRSPIPREKEEEARRQLTDAGLLGHGTSVEEARRLRRREEEPSKKVEITGFPPGTLFPGGRSAEGGEGEGRPPPVGREERGYGTIIGEIREKKTNKPLPEAEVIALSPEIQRDIPGDVSEDKQDKKTKFSIQVPTTSRGILYIVYAQAPEHKRSQRKQVVVKNDETKDAGILELEPEKKEIKIGEKAKKELSLWSGKIGWNPLAWINLDWFQKNWWRLAVALGLTLLFFFAVYKPTFDKLGQDIGPVTWLIPVLFFFIILFTLKPTGEGSWLPFIMASLMAIGAWVGLTFFTKGVGKASFIQWGVPLATYLITYFGVRKSKSPVGTLVFVVGIMFLAGSVVLLVSLIRSGEAFNIETYLKALNVLNLVGVPQDTIDDMKSGVRNTLSFLQFKGAEPTKPEAKKIGGFEAIELKFGSRHNNYLLPTLFARMDYVLPVTVTNPNKFDTKLVVKDFKIEDVFLNNGSNRIICGSTTKEKPDPKDTKTITVPTGSFSLGNINPEEEKSATIDFKGKTLNDLNPQDNTPDGTSVDCRSVLTEAGKSSITNPMFPAKVKKSMSKADAEKSCKEDPTNNIKNDGACVGILQDFYNRYFKGGQIPTVASKDVSARYVESESVCECKLNRYYNIMDDLCFMDNDKAKITLRSSYGFKVQGKGELILVKAEADKKLAPKPTITSSAGPLTVTTYFVSDIHVPEKTKTSIMFVQIANDGDGTAEINNLKINSAAIGATPLPLESGMVNINQCQPSGKVSVAKDGITLSCPVAVDDAIVKTKVTGAYLTVPVIVDVDYTYTQTHSTTINVKKESIPEGIDDTDKIQELDRQFKPLPYYCPNERSESIPDGTPALKIYDTKITTAPAVVPPKLCTAIDVSTPAGKSECDGRPDCRFIGPLPGQPAKCDVR